MIGGTLAVERPARAPAAPTQRVSTVIGGGAGVSCSFCRRESDRVATMIAGQGVAICDECVERCERVLHQAHRALRAQVAA